MRALVLAFVFIVAFSAATVAAVVSPLQGEVRISSGQGFQRIVAPTNVASGAQVMVSPGGSASIVYADNCAVRVVSAIAAILSRSPCASYPQPWHFGLKVEQGASAAEQDQKVGSGDQQSWATEVRPKVEQGASAAEQDQKVGSGDPPFDHTILMVGGLVVGAGVAAALIIANEKPASP
jgi:hypothetical protein